MSDVEGSRSSSSSVSEKSTSKPNKTKNKKCKLDRRSTSLIYRHLVASSCVGILQVWWHPYLHDLTKLVPFLCLYVVFAILVAYPVMYLELAIGAVTRKSPLACWDLAPVARGVGVVMLVSCMVASVVAGAVASWMLSLSLEARHAALPWVPAGPNVMFNDTEAQSFFFESVLHVNNGAPTEGVGPMVQELVLYQVITWLIVYLIVMKRICLFSKLSLVKDILVVVVLVWCGVWAARLEGADAMFDTIDWSVLAKYQIWIEALEYALLQTCLSHGSLITLGSYCPLIKHNLCKTSCRALTSAMFTTVGVALILGATHGAMQPHLHNNVFKGVTSSLVLWTDLVSRLPANRFWTALVFITFYVMAVMTMALLMHTLKSTFTGDAVRELSWAFMALFMALFCVVGVGTVSTQKGVYIVSFLLKWPVLKTSTIIATVVTSSYGKDAFCAQVHRATGEYPCIFFRIPWLLLSWILLVALACNMWQQQSVEAEAGWVLLTLCVSPVFIVAIVYLVFKWRVRKLIVSDTSIMAQAGVAMETIKVIRGRETDEKSPRSAERNFS